VAEKPALPRPQTSASATRRQPERFGPLAFSPFVAAPSSASEDALYAQEIEVLRRKGMSPARAERALSAQSRVARKGVVEKIKSVAGFAYGGAWFEPASAQWHIGVTSSVGRQAAEKVILREGLASDVTLTSARSTWAQLEAAQKRWNRRLSTLIERGQVMTALSAQHNAVSVSLSSSVPKVERATLKREAADANVNTLVRLVPGRLGIVPAGDKTECKKFVAEKEAYCNKPITSGVSIGASNDEINYECTAGPLAIPKTNVTETYLLTAGHCISEAGGEKIEWDSWYKGGILEQHLIGKAKTFVNNLSGDYGEIPVENAAWMEAGNEPVFAVTAEWKANNERSYQVIREGMSSAKIAVCHDGEVTGGSCGESLTTGVTAMVWGGGKVEGLVEVEGPTLKCKKGDSGGPFFFVEENLEVIMEGILIGVAPGGLEHICYYEPIHTALEGLKLELLTKNNENRAKDKEEKEAKEAKEAKEGKEAKEEKEEEGRPQILCLTEVCIKGLEGTFEAGAESQFVTLSGKSVIATGAKLTISGCESWGKTAKDTHLCKDQTLDLTGVKSEKVGCNTEGDAKETVLVLLDLQLAAELNKAETALEPLLLVKILNAKLEAVAIKVKCGVLSLEWKGTVGCLVAPGLKDVATTETVEVACKVNGTTHDPETGKCELLCEWLEKESFAVSSSGKFEDAWWLLPLSGTLNKDVFIDD
jgi:hypothetical protein